MWITSSGEVLGDSDQYTAPDGTRYPRGFPKSEIPGLSPVQAVAPVPGPHQDAVRDGVELVAGKWREKWRLVDWPAERVAEAQAATAARALPVIRFLVTHSPAEIEAHVQATVTNLAAAKDLLGRLAVAISILGKRELRE